MGRLLKWQDEVACKVIMESNRELLENTLIIARGDANYDNPVPRAILGIQPQG